MRKYANSYSVLDYRIDLYFHNNKFAIEVDEKGHKDRNIDHEIQRQKELEKELICKFIRIDPGEEDFNIFKALNEIHRHITKSTEKLTKKSTKKSIIDDAKTLLKATSEFSNNDTIFSNNGTLSLEKTLLDTSCLQYKE